MKRALYAVILALSLVPPAKALSMQAPTISVFFSPPGKFQPALEKEIERSRRFIVLPSSASVRLPSSMDAAITRLKKFTKADFALVGTISDHNSDLKMQARLYNLDLNDASKVLRFEGGPADTSLLMKQLLAFLKSRHPLKCQVLGLEDELVLLNVGAEDGVDPGSFFEVYPDVGIDPRPIGRIQVLKTEAWFSTATTLSIRKNRQFIPGDIAVEDVAAQQIQP